MARLVLNHSTFIPGLQKVLKRMTLSELITTIVPGRIYKTLSNHKTGLELRLTTVTNNRGAEIISNNSDNSNNSSYKDDNNDGRVTQKVIARNNSLMQEVFLVINNKNFTDSITIEKHLQKVLAKEKCTIVSSKRQSVICNDNE